MGRRGQSEPQAVISLGSRGTHVIQASGSVSGMVSQSPTGVMRCVMSHNSGGRHTAGTDSVEGSDRQRKRGQKELGARTSSIHTVIKQVPCSGPKVFLPFFHGGSHIYRTVLRLTEVRSAAACKDRKQMCLFLSGEILELRQTGIWDPLLQCLYLDKCLLRQHNTKKLQETKNNCVHG